MTLALRIGMSPNPLQQPTSRWSFRVTCSRSSEGRFLKLYDPSGKYLGRIVNSEGSPAAFSGISGLCATSDGTMLATSGNRVMEFTLLGKF